VETCCWNATDRLRHRDGLRPYLFAIYLDELSVLLGSARVRWTVGNMTVDHLMFSDDICVLGPNVSALQRLLNNCGDYVADHEIVFSSYRQPV